MDLLGGRTQGDSMECDCLGYCPPRCLCRCRSVVPSIRESVSSAHRSVAITAWIVPALASYPAMAQRCGSPNQGSLKGHAVQSAKYEWKPGMRPKNILTSHEVLRPQANGVSQWPIGLVQYSETAKSAKDTKA